MSAVMGITEAMCVAIGAAAGGSARYVVTRLAANAPFSGGDALGTTIVNAVGAALLGWLAALLARHAIGPTIYALMAIGFCGALTTWSTLARGVADRALDSAYTRAVIYLAANLALGLGAVTIGWWLGS